MPADFPPFPDVEQVLLDLFADLATGAAAQLVTTLPAALQQELPLIRVRRLGGGDDRWTDQARCDVEVYGDRSSGSRTALRLLADQLRQRVLSWPHTTTHGVIDHALTEVGPQEVPYEDQDVRVLAATYRLSLRRP